jgi:hypothetical protein
LQAALCILVACLAVAAVLPAQAQSPTPGNLTLIDRPSDDGTALLLLFDMQDDDGARVVAEVQVDGEWLPVGLRPRPLSYLDTKADRPAYFGWTPSDPDQYVLEVDRYYQTVEPTAEELAENPDAQPLEQSSSLNAGTEYTVRLAVTYNGSSDTYDAGSAVPREQLFNKGALNHLVFSVLFAIIIMSFILAARRNPNLFVRRIQGLEAVDEAIGRATEMGKPVLQVNGLDPLSTLSTIAAVNILGRIARKVANYDSELLVPSFDPVVMTVSQEVVKNAYIEAGRPDAYREDSIYFVTDQQFSYVASVCGIMLRDKPAANFFLGYFYAESLLLAETGSTTGAIQIAGTDALSQLPFFITTCDYTLIGEELYAASAYLAKEPMLLGSLKGQDVGKAFIMVVIIVGSVLATFGIMWLTHLLTPLS